MLVAAILLLKTGSTQRRALFLLVPVIGFYLLAAQSALNIGYRHVLPALPFLLLLVSGLVAPELRAFGRGRFSPRVLLIVGQIVLIGVAMWVYPGYLSYFNPAVGGPSNGYRLLTDSNVDWGQDLLRLKEWMDDNDVERVKLGWFGTALSLIHISEPTRPY